MAGERAVRHPPHLARTLPGHKGCTAHEPGLSPLTQPDALPGPGADERGHGPAAGLPSACQELLLVWDQAVTLLTQRQAAVQCTVCPLMFPVARSCALAGCSLCTSAPDGQDPLRH